MQLTGMRNRRKNMCILMSGWIVVIFYLTLGKFQINIRLLENEDNHWQIGYIRRSKQND
jgi:hypothetical protein